ncbi:MAG: EpsI family protein [Desulfocapsaceae bacterium]|nr:EpsI family protein [Desulfosporosinus sp.]MDR3629543.1 EpsI family protein [Desulfocapsaceae bacterium]
MNGTGRIFIILLLFLATWYTLQVTSGVQAIPIKRALSSFPDQIGDYTLLKSFQSSASVVKLLGVDDYIDYNYSNPSSRQVNFYVGFYSSVGVGGEYHSPKNCLPGGGWGIDAVKTVRLHAGVEGGKRSSVTEMLIRNGDQYQVVLYWYQNRGRIIASEYWEKIYLVLDALTKGRRDGAFVRIMVTVKGTEIENAERIAQNFAEQAMGQLENFLPGARL